MINRHLTSHSPLLSDLGSEGLAGSSFGEGHLLKELDLSKSGQSQQEVVQLKWKEEHQPTKLRIRQQKNFGLSKITCLKHFENIAKLTFSSGGPQKVAKCVHEEDNLGFKANNLADNAPDYY